MSIEVSVLDETAGAEAGADEIAALLARKPTAVIGLATGSSPLPLYAALAARVHQGQLDFSRVTGFALDEYIGLPAGSAASYAEYLEREVRAPLRMRPGSVRVPDASATDLARASASFEEEISDAGGVDLQIVGIGANGHLGFNEPGSQFDSRTRVAELAESTRAANARFFPSPESVPTLCITQGLATILDARRILLLATGAAKARALELAVNGHPSPDCPASSLRSHPSVRVIATPAAAALLSRASSRTTTQESTDAH
jgi:glucosamine-6-phosphate deaminase